MTVKVVWGYSSLFDEEREEGIVDVVIIERFLFRPSFLCLTSGDVIMVFQWSLLLLFPMSFQRVLNLNEVVNIMHAMITRVCDCSIFIKQTRR